MPMKARIKQLFDLSSHSKFRSQFAVSLSFSSSGGETSIVWIVSGSSFMLLVPSIVIIIEISFCFGSFSELI